MSDQNQATHQITVHAQYVRDFSFESPSAPQIFAPTQAVPQINVGVNVQTRKLEADIFEVMLLLKLEAKLEDKTAFIAELAYGGVFGLAGLAEDRLQLFLFIDAPHMLFPFARTILANAVRDGGFPQVLINPIDFAGLYQQQQAQMNAPAQGQA